MMRQLFMQQVVGAPVDWGLASADFARAWARSALAAARSGAPGAAGGTPPANRNAFQGDFWPEELLAGVGRWAHPAPDRKWSEAPRPMSVPARRLSRREVLAAEARRQLDAAPPADVVPEARLRRPATRAECIDGPRPCPWVTCRHHLYLDVSERGWIKLNFPHLEPWEMRDSCSLDIADRNDDGVTLEKLGRCFNISLEGARQLELDVLAEARAKLGDEAVAGLLGGGGE